VCSSWWCLPKCVLVCWSVLQCVAVCCSVLQCVAVCCSVLQWRQEVRGAETHEEYVWGSSPSVARCCRVLQCVAVCCSVLLCVAVGWNVLVISTAYHKGRGRLRRSLIHSLVILLPAFDTHESAFSRRFDTQKSRTFHQKSPIIHPKGLINSFMSYPLAFICHTSISLRSPQKNSAL